MKIFLKYILLPLLVILGIYLLLCLAGPKDFNVKKDIKIDAPTPVVFNLVNSLKKSEMWNPWTLEDTTIVTNYNDILVGVGAESNWTSTMMGDGAQKIIESEANSRVKSSLTFVDQGATVNHAEFLLTPSGKKTELSWSFESGEVTPFLARGFLLLSGMKSAMKNSYEDGLDNIKRIAEQRSSEGIYYGFEIKQKEMPERSFVLSRQEVAMSNIQQFYATNLGGLFNKVQASGVEMKGMPCGLFFRWEKNGIVDMAAAIPVSKPISIDGAASLNMPERNTIQIDYYGEYSGTSAAHAAIDDYMKDKGYFMDPPVIEEYITDPTTEKDPNKWLTRIIYYFSE
jgi:effector-binding domain-containing protein